MVAPLSSKPFDFDAQYGQGYDTLIRAVFPGYESFFHATASVLSLKVPTDGRVLVMGCGTGTELTSFARLQPHWRLTGIDPSPTMIQVCRQRLGNHPGLTLHEGYLNTLAADEPFDGGTSVLVMHFLRDDGSKLAYLKEVRSRLRPGAGYVHLDVIGWNPTAAWKQVMVAWERNALSLGLEKERFDSLVEQIRVALFGVSETRMEQLFAEAGFSQIHRFWMAFHHTGWVMEA